MKIRSVGAELFHADGRRPDRQMHDEANNCLRTSLMSVHKFKKIYNI